jgi:hypothetical protein
MKPDASIFESFNAKNLRPEQVAKSFVSSTNFRNLARRRHSLIIGPRGSGKTTLLKMLQSEALDAWNPDDLGHIKNKIDFNGVFIPTDRVWKEQIDSLGNGIFTKDEKEIFSTSIFTTHVLYQLSVSFEYKTKNYEHDLTSEFIYEISSAWGLNLRSYSFRSLTSSLIKRKGEIPRLVNALKRFTLEERNIHLKDDNFSYLYNDVVQLINVSIDLFSTFFPNETPNWALLFDELELAPKCVVQKLLDALRGSNDRLILKLSMAPFSPDVTVVKDIFSAMPGNDYDFVLLWNSQKKDSNREFSANLLKSMLEDRGLNSLRPDEIFGRPTLILRSQVFKIAYNRDLTFKKYIDDKSIDIDKIDELNSNEKYSIVGKVAPILRLRNVARKSQEENKQPSYVSLKSLPDYYSGTDSLFDILEGNPRWFIGVITSLLDEYELTKIKIKPARQLQELKKTLDKFLLLLRTIPSPITNNNKKNSQGVDFAINLIGEYFKENMILADFHERPRGSFVVDNLIDETIQSSLGAALNAGALVHITKDLSQVFLTDLSEQRFRLSYLLSPKYSLPLSLMAPINLSNILNKKDDKYEPSLFE